MSTSSGAGIVLSTNDEVFNVKMDSGEIVSENVDNVKLIGQTGADDDNESMFSLHAVFNPLDGVMNEPKLPFEETIQRSGSLKWPKLSSCKRGNLKFISTI